MKDFKVPLMGMACRLGSQTQDCDFREQQAQSNGSVEETAGLRLHLGSGWNSPPVPEPAFHTDDDSCSNADFSCSCMTKLFVIRLKALHGLFRWGLWHWSCCELVYWLADCDYMLNPHRWAFSLTRADCSQSAQGAVWRTFTDTS